MRKLSFSVSSFALAFFCTAPAIAQQTDASSTDAPESQSPSDQRYNQSPGDIVVTAQRTSQKLQQVPITMQAFTGENLQQLGIRDARALQTITPGLNLGGAWTNSTPTVFLRGVGDNSYNANNVSAVGFYFDDVYVGSSTGINQLMLDLDRVEVLKGPQGTLYGRNTTGGAMNFISIQPKVGEGFSGDGFVTAGTYGFYEGKIGLTVPINDRMAARIALVASDNRGAFDGSQTKLPGRDVSSFAGRATIAYQATDDLKLTASINGSRSKSAVTDKAFGTYDPVTFDLCSPQQIRANACVDGSGFRASDNFKTEDEGTRSQDVVRTFGASLNVVQDIGDYAITSISSYNWNKRRLREDIDHLPGDFILNDWATSAEQFSQEVRVNSPAQDRLRWTLGAFFLSEQLHSVNALAVRGFPGIFTGSSALEGDVQTIRQKTTSYAGFGQAYFDVTSKLTLTVGARWNYERKIFSLASDAYDISGTTPDLVLDDSYDSGLFLARLIDQQERRSWRNWSGRVALDYKIASDVMLFGSISKGVKAGGFNGGATFSPAEEASVDPEKLTAYEIGIKSDLFDRILRLNVSLFDYEYKDQQVYVLRSVGPIVTTNLSNAGQSRIYGFDIDATLRPVAGLMIQGSAEWLKARIRQFDATGPGVIDFTGNTLPRAPRWSASGLVQYDIRLANGGEISLQSDIRYTSKVFFDVSNNPNLVQNAFAVVGARIGYKMPDTKIDISAWVKNVFDKAYYQDGYDNASLGWVVYPVGDPRTAGVTLNFRF